MVAGYRCQAGTAKEQQNLPEVCQNRATEAAQRAGYDGVVCGHIHRAEFRRVNGIEYWNDGDWVESCTATTEAMDGTMDILHYAPSTTTVQALRTRAAQRLNEVERSLTFENTPSQFLEALV